jgi:LysM repeat protein
MEQGILTGVLAISLTLLNPSSAPTAQITSQTNVNEARVYTVENGDTLSKIAEEEYGSIDYWTTIWNDNDFIKDPNTIEEGWRLRIKNTRPTEPEELKSELKEKANISIIPSTVVELNQAQPQNTNPVQTFVPQATTAQAQSYNGGPLNEAQINYLGNCESGMRANTNTGNGFYGAFQFTIGTWNAMETGYARADLAPLDVQIGAVQKLLSRSSIYTQFPGCARKMQANGIL